MDSNFSAVSTKKIRSSCRSVFARSLLVLGVVCASAFSHASWSVVYSGGTCTNTSGVGVWGQSSNYYTNTTFATVGGPVHVNLVWSDPSGAPAPSQLIAYKEQVSVTTANPRGGGNPTAYDGFGYGDPITYTPFFENGGGTLGQTTGWTYGVVNSGGSSTVALPDLYPTGSGGRVVYNAAQCLTTFSPLGLSLGGAIQAGYTYSAKTGVDTYPAPTGPTTLPCILVGQRLLPSISGILSGLTQLTQGWVTGGLVIGSPWNATISSASTPPAPNMLANNPTWYYVTGGTPDLQGATDGIHLDAVSVAFGFQWQTAGGSTKLIQNLTLAQPLNVWRPYQSISESGQPASWTAPLISGVECQYNSTSVVGTPPIFSAYYGDGQSAFVQLGNIYLQYVVNGLNHTLDTTNNTYELDVLNTDTTWMYTPNDPVTDTITINAGPPVTYSGAQDDFPDAPGTEFVSGGWIISESYTLNDSFVDSVMFWPNSSSASWVPLMTDSWNASSYANYTWPPSPPGGSAVTASGLSITFPTWTQYHVTTP